MRRVVIVSVACWGAVLSLRASGEPVFHPAAVTPLGAHVCAGFYPEAAREAHIGGVASLSFRITANGTISNVVVARSSGNVDLDDAAKSCARTWRFVPVQKDGKPVEAAWEADVEFKAAAAEPQPMLQLPVLVEQDQSACFRYPWWALRHHAEGNAIIHYSVMPGGAVTDIAMSKSSGDNDLDEAAMSCVKSFKYRPLSGNNTPKPATARVTWSYLEHAPSLVRWTFLGATLPAVEATQKIRRGVAECLQGASGHPEFASGFAGVTTLRTRYRRGEITDVSVVSTSGNDALDRFAADCYKSEAPDADRAEVFRNIGSGAFQVVWRQYVHS